MPIEIRELIIRAQVDTSEQPGNTADKGTNGTIIEEQYLMQKLEQVLEVIRDKNER